MNQTITIDTGDTVLTLPARWAICGCCQGCGTDRGASVECDGGGFTGSEWAEQGEDFQRDYLAGFYDRPCEPCKGSGKVLVVNRAQADRKLLKEYDAHLREEQEYRAMCAAERRMGC